MPDDDWCHASWYVIYPVARLPHLARDSFRYSEAARSNRCMRRGMPVWERLTRQIIPIRLRNCCYYHSVDWPKVAAEAIRLAQKVPLAAQQAAWLPEDDTSESQAAYERVWRPYNDLFELVNECDLPERECEAVTDLLDPAAAICLHHLAGSLTYVNGRHRAHALMSAGVRWVPVLRYHCCHEAQDCSPPYCYRLTGPLPAAHSPDCELTSPNVLGRLRLPPG